MAKIFGPLPAEYKDKPDIAPILNLVNGGHVKAMIVAGIITIDDGNMIAEFMYNHTMDSVKGDDSMYSFWSKLPDTLQDQLNSKPPIFLIATASDVENIRASYQAKLDSEKDRKEKLETFRDKFYVRMTKPSKEVDQAFTDAKKGLQDNITVLEANLANSIKEGANLLHSTIVH